MTDTFQPDRTDLSILDALQQEIPLVPRPYREIASRIGIPEETLLERLQRLRDAGVLRGISPVIESRPMGLAAATLVALPVPVNRITDVAAVISRHPEVSHNFRRDHRYSIWFTIAAKDDDDLREVLDAILLETGISRERILDLPTVRKIKIDVQFPFSRNREVDTDGPA